MKLWMKALVWLGLGGGIGFFAGYRVGLKFGYDQKTEEDCSADAQEIESKYQTEISELKEKHRVEMETARTQFKEAMAAQRKYFGEKDDETISEGQMEMDIDEDADDDVMNEEPEMPEDVLDEIEQLHPQDILPYGISASEYEADESGYDKIELDYYTEDGVIFDPRREEKWTRPEQLLGIGWKTRFISSGDKPIREVFIKNDTMECLYKITRIDDSFERLYEEE
jgi:hypothetical protein